MAPNTWTFRMPRPLHHPLTAVALAATLAVAACGGGSTDSGGSGAVPQSMSVPFVISDASSQDWSSIQVTITSVVLNGSSGATANLLSAPVTVNLEQLDQSCDDASLITRGTDADCAEAPEPPESVLPPPQAATASVAASATAVSGW